MTGGSSEVSWISPPRVDLMLAECIFDELSWERHCGQTPKKSRQLVFWMEGMPLRSLRPSNLSLHHATDSAVSAASFPERRNALRGAVFHLLSAYIR